MDDDDDEEVQPNDMILAGGAGEDQSAYQKMLADGEAYLGSTVAGKQIPPIELKNWIQWYLALEDHDFLVEVERSFILDQLNLIKLRESCENPQLTKKRFKEALRLILSSKVPNEEDL